MPDHTVTRIFTDPLPAQRPSILLQEMNQSLHRTAVALTLAFWQFRPTAGAALLFSRSFTPSQ